MGETNNKPEFGYDTYLSPFTKRYGSKEMRELFSDMNSYRMQRDMWCYLAFEQGNFGLVTNEEFRDIDAHRGQEHINIERIRELDRTIRHDLMSHVKTYAEQCKVGGGKIHLGATSMDIEDNVDILKSRQASDILITRIVNTLDSMRPYISEKADMPCVAWTHLQPAGYTTIGYRFANYAQDLMLALGMMEYVMENHLKGKGMKGIAGTSSSYRELLGNEQNVKKMEKSVMENMGLKSFPVATQVYPRIVDYTQLSALAALATAAHKFALDLRLLSAPFLGEMYKRPKKEKVGSSAAPWKVFNPTEAERINSLARYISVLPEIAWMNASNNIFERTLDDSANRRIILSEGYLAADQMMMEYDNILRHLGLREGTIAKNLRNYGTFMKTDPLMMEAVKRGANRQKFHEQVRKHILPAYEKMLETGQNPLSEMLKNDQEVLKIFKAKEIGDFLNIEKELDAELGTAELDALAYLKNELDPKIETYNSKLGNHPEPEF